MGVFRDISIPFGGRDYVVTPSNRLLRMIEAKGRRDDTSFNLVAVFYRAASGAGAVNELAFVLAELINSAGGKTTEDGAFAELMAFKDAKEFRAYVDLICGCVMPEVKETKKPEADGAAAMETK
jgi:hypothetical protein